MPESREERYRRLLDRQLAMNRQTWTTLEKHGVTLSTRLHLEFMYWAPDQSSAERLKDLLEDKTDYELRPLRSAEQPQREWYVGGTTQATTISPEILDQWVDWMVSAGLEFGCEFDGWGTTV